MNSWLKSALNLHLVLKVVGSKKEEKVAWENELSQNCCNPHPCYQAVNDNTEVNISPKISISAQPLKMALHKNPAMHGSRIAIILHESKKMSVLHD